MKRRKLRSGEAKLTRHAPDNQAQPSTGCLLCAFVCVALLLAGIRRCNSTGANYNSVQGATNQTSATTTHYGWRALLPSDDQLKGSNGTAIIFYGQAPDVCFFSSEDEIPKRHRTNATRIAINSAIASPHAAWDDGTSIYIITGDARIEYS